MLRVRVYHKASDSSSCAFWILRRLSDTCTNLHKRMIDSATHGTVMPSEAHFSWTDLFYSDLYPVYREPPPDVPSQWTSVLPEHWSKDHVCEWLQYCCDNYKLDATCIPFSQFNVTGLQLCNMSKEDFTEAAGACGHYLYSLLQDIRTRGAPLLSCIEESPPPRSMEYPGIILESDATHNHHAGKDKTHIKPEEVKKHKSPKPSRTGLHSSHLWEFLRDLLLSPEDNNGILDWEDQQQGIFRVVKSEALAQKWGQRKRNNRMNYEKLSRAMRHYYKTGILERVDRRLVYKFGKNAYGWH